MKTAKPTNKRALLAGMLVWFCLMGPIINWSSNPVLRPPGKAMFNITPEQTAKEFPIRLVPLPKPTPPPPAKPGAKAKNAPVTVHFNYDTWAWQESRRRLLGGFIAWCVLGIVIQWVMARVFRDR